METRHDLAALLYRAAAALETPADLTEDDVACLTEDLVVAAGSLEAPYPRTSPSGFLNLSTRQTLEALRFAKHPAWQTLSNRYVNVCSEIAKTLAEEIGAEPSASFFGFGTTSHAIRMPDGMTELPPRFLPPDFAAIERRLDEKFGHGTA